MAPLYKPPTAVQTRETPLLSVITAIDPGFNRAKYYEPEYRFDNRVSYANPYQRGAYNRLSNDYPVGQQYGGPDPLVIDNLEPTVGNDVPGLYEGIPDGKGWA